MNQMTSVPQVQASQPATFSGDRGEFRRLVMRGGFLEFVTVGFYRFWLATDLRRHLWANTSVDGDAVEYTGTAKELLVGFLIALAILAPLYVGYFLLGLEAETWQAFASTPLVVLLYLFGQFAIYRARRYRLTPHGVARGAVLDDRLGLGLCVARRAVGPGDGADARTHHAVAQRRARALQDGPFALWRVAGPVRGTRRRSVQARLVDLGAGAGVGLAWCRSCRRSVSSP